MQLFKRFFNAEDTGYGYADDTVKSSPFVFGLNARAAKLTKFEWIPNGGAQGAEQEALDIVFNINGTDKNYRMFPVVKAFDKNNQEITDRNAQEFKDALTDFNSRITHIMHAFVEHDAYKAAMSRPFKSFKEYVQHAASLLPSNFREVELDIFLQYQWQPSEGQTRTFLEIPKKMKYGSWLKKSADFPGNWTEHRAENIQESTKKALWYTNEKGEEHPFTKNGWFMLSPFAKPIRGEENKADSGAATAMNSNATAQQAPAASAPAGTPPSTASAW